jgi:hypothetical protein
MDKFQEKIKLDLREASAGRNPEGLLPLKMETPAPSSDRAGEFRDHGGNCYLLKDKARPVPTFLKNPFQPTFYEIFPVSMLIPGVLPPSSVHSPT